jgi:streptomycin 3"-adenylyltransferase
MDRNPIAIWRAGWPVCGPPPQDLIGVVPRRAILDYLAAELGWGIEHAPEAYAVLNACRALSYLTGHKIVSKIAGGEAVLSSGTGPAGVIERAGPAARQRTGPATGCRCGQLRTGHRRGVALCCR